MIVDHRVDNEIKTETDIVNIPDWKVSNEIMAEQIVECLNRYKAAGKPIKSILVTADEPTVIEYYNLERK